MSDADDAYAHALGLIEKAQDSGARRLGLDVPKCRALTRLPPGIAGLSALTWLDLDNTQVQDIAPLAGLTNLTKLSLSGTQVQDITPLAGLTALTELSLGGTQVQDITPLAGLTNLTGLDLISTAVKDLRPALQDHGSVPKEAFFDILTYLDFRSTPAAASSPKLTALAAIEDDAERTRKTLEYLRSLPPWPEPLPWEVNDQDTSSPVADEPSTEQTILAGETATRLPATTGTATVVQRVTLAQARRVLKEDFPLLRDRVNFVMAELNGALSQTLPAKPNDPEQLRDWEHLVRTLEFSRAAMLDIADALPEELEGNAITDADANALRKAFEMAIGKLQQASTYIESMDGDQGHGRTYAGLLKIGVCAALAVPIGLIAAQPISVVGGGVYAMLYGKGAALDVIKAIRDSKEG